MADARDSKSREGNFMRVRPPPPAPEKKLHLMLVFEQVQKASLLDLFFLNFAPNEKRTLLAFLRNRLIGFYH